MIRYSVNNHWVKRQARRESLRGKLLDRMPDWLVSFFVCVLKIWG